MNIIQLIIKTIKFNVNAWGSSIKLFLLIRPYIIDSTGLPHEKCPCGSKSKKIFLESPEFKAWYQENNKYINFPKFEVWKGKCFCGDENINTSFRK
jgi:hypothetical protein